MSITTHGFGSVPTTVGWGVEAKAGDIAPYGLRPTLFFSEELLPRIVETKADELKPSFYGQIVAPRITGADRVDERPEIVAAFDLKPTLKGNN